MSYRASEDGGSRGAHRHHKEEHPGARCAWADVWSRRPKRRCDRPGQPDADDQASGVPGQHAGDILHGGQRPPAPPMGREKTVSGMCVQSSYDTM